MRKLLFILLPAFLLASCKSREEKVAELIKQEMFKTLYDFESYEPIETKIDSAFTSIYTDSIIRSYAYSIDKLSGVIREDLDKTKEYENTLKIWAYSSSYYGKKEFKDAYEKFQEHLDKANNNLSIVEGYMDSIKNISSNFKPEFYGWKATHRFRCKAKGGNFDLGDYIYIFDKNLKHIISYHDANDEKNKIINGIIDEAIKSNKDNKF